MANLGYQSKDLSINMRWPIVNQVSWTYSLQFVMDRDKDIPNGGINGINKGSLEVEPTTFRRDGHLC